MIAEVTFGHRNSEQNNLLINQIVDLPAWAPGASTNRDLGMKMVHWIRDVRKAQSCGTAMLAVVSKSHTKICWFCCWMTPGSHYKPYYIYFVNFHDKNMLHIICSVLPMVLAILLQLFPQPEARYLSLSLYLDGDEFIKWMIRIDYL